MKIQYIIKSLLGVAILCATFVSCSEDTMDRINANTSNPTDVLSKYIMTNVMTSTGFSAVGGDMNSYLSIYVEHEAGVDNQFHRAETRDGEPSNSSTFNNTWGAIYTTIKDVKIVIAKCSEGGSEEGSPILGVAQFFAAYNLAVLTDMFGDVPWKEAGDYTVSMTPAIDKQEVIYQDIMTYVDNAIANLQKNASNGMATQDFIYGGNNTKWLKAAYALKARLTMRLLNRSSNVQGDMQTVLDCVSKSFTSAGEQCSLAIFGGSNINPMFGTFWSRKGISASKSMFDKIVEYGDPRIGRCFMDPDKQVIFTSATDKGLNLAPNGNPIQQKLIYNNSIFVAAQTAPVHLISYHEILFLKAEALYHLNRKDEAKAALKDAIIAGFANTEKNISDALASGYWGGFEVKTDAITPEVAATYVDSSVAARFDANPLKEIMNQKYIALWGANGESVETFCDVRRMKAMGYDFYGFQNSNKFPLRTPYGNGDTTTNPNVNAAYGDGRYIYTDNVWWAGGSH
ncbi:MAG: SusD/RagB family nutrient-binding outer membrane lipoprotein [Tannerellaceae bacterium]|nr:SusD/RagB family nutrient-binding outer membrane lipoprotein [Tannerellaceae bacterium]